ncbi:hypothetical protein D3C75_1227960 [compost metagenome]
MQGIGVNFCCKRSRQFKIGYDAVRLHINLLHTLPVRAGLDRSLCSGFIAGNGLSFRFLQNIREGNPPIWLLPVQDAHFSFTVNHPFIRQLPGEGGDHDINA